MIELFEIFLIAIAQGIGEFLPISSSGHNAVLNHLFAWFGEPLTGDGAEFVKLNVLLHVGSLIAVLIVFRHRIIDMLSRDRRLIALLIVATIPAGLVGLLVKQYAPWIQDDLRIISGCFLITGFLLLSTLRLPEGKKTTFTMTWRDALIIGCVQAIAILPGISRSGSTIVAGLFCRLKREDAAAFSFILSIPIITAGGLLEGKDLLDAELTGTLSTGLLFIGALVSFIAGFVALVFLMDWIKKGKLWYFAIWVFIMSPIALALFLTKPALGTADGRQQTAAEQSGQQLSGCDFAGTPTHPPLLLDLLSVDDGDFEVLREKVLAEERAKELALIEEERKTIPLVDEPEKLIPLDEQDRIWITQDRNNVVLISRVVLQEGFLELLACRVRTKEHESILSVRVKPQLVHAALLATNARQGKPMQMRPVFVPATGNRIDIILRWRDESGSLHESPAQDWVWDMSSPEDDKKPMTTHWVFSGSREYQDDEGMNRYLADETGELFGLSNFVGSILDVPIESSADNVRLQFSCFTERIPSVDTLVTIVLTPVR